MTGSGPRRRRGWLYLLGALCSEVTGSLSLRGALDHPALYLLVAAGFIVAFGLLAKVLSTGMSLGVAYGIWAASGVALTAIMSNIIFAEPLTPIMMAGIVLIMGGVLCIELGSQAARAPTEKPA